MLEDSLVADDRVGNFSGQRGESVMRRLQSFALLPQVGDLLHQTADAFDAFLESFTVKGEDFVFDQVIHRANFLVGDGFYPGLRSRSGVLPRDSAFSAEPAIQSTEVVPFAWEMDGVVALPFEHTDHLLGRHPLLLRAVLEQLCHGETDAIQNDQHLGPLQHGYPVVPNGVDSCRGGDKRGEGFGPLFSLVRHEHCAHIGLGAVRPRKLAVLGSNHVRLEVPFGLLTLVLSHFSLGRVEVKDALVARCHQHLQRIQEGGFAGATPPGQQAHVAELVVPWLDLPPVAKNQVINLHGPAPRRWLALRSPHPHPMPIRGRHS
ncbi:hypothetical protein FQZ97_407190 [compost metagenome]